MVLLSSARSGPHFQHYVGQVRESIEQLALPRQWEQGRRGTLKSAAEILSRQLTNRICGCGSSWERAAVPSLTRWSCRAKTTQPTCRFGCSENCSKCGEN